MPLSFLIVVYLSSLANFIRVKL
jgi:hypothetical protein